MTHLVRIVAMKNQALVSTQGSLLSAQASLSAPQMELKSMCLKNASLTQSLDDCATASLGEVS